MAGPQPGPQPDVRFCPVCKAELRNVASRMQRVPDSHRYECDACGRAFEINEFPSIGGNVKSVTGTINAFRLKKEHQQLFKNLGSGDVLLLKQAFDDPNAINRKSFASEEEGARCLELMMKLVDAGFVVEFPDSEVTYVEKG